MSSSQHTSRRSFLRRSTAAAFGAGLGLGTKPARPEQTRFEHQGSPGAQPNIVFIYTDNHSYDQVGCYPHSYVDTPNLDQLAADGIQFTNYAAAAPVCTPSRSGMLTGRYPHRNGLFDNIRNNMVDYDHEYTELEYTLSPEMTQGLDVRETTMATALSEGGYRTGMVGKWDSGRQPQWMPLQRGFDFFYGFCNTGIDYWTHERYGIPSLFRGNKRITADGYATNLFADEGERFIRRNQEEPFFLYAAFNAPGGAANLDGPSYQAPDEYIEMYDDPPGDTIARLKATVKCLDDGIGQLLSTLDELGLRENTLVVFASDGGGRSPEHLRSGHANMYEGNLRVPCIARWPGRIPEGTVSDAFFTGLDFFPTFLSVANIAAPEELHLDGIDMLPVFKDEADSPRSEYFWELRGKRAARRNHWKWVGDTGERWRYPTMDQIPSRDAPGQLYNLEEDPAEQNDLADQHPNIENELRSRWYEWMTEMANAADRGPFSRAYFDLLGFGDGSYRL